jgi:hypothetical protein
MHYVRAAKHNGRGYPRTVCIRRALKERAINEGLQFIDSSVREGRQADTMREEGFAPCSEARWSPSTFARNVDGTR